MAKVAENPNADLRIRNPEYQEISKQLFE